jgi:hypothetical protein
MRVVTFGAPTLGAVELMAMEFMAMEFGGQVSSGGRAGTGEKSDFKKVRNLPQRLAYRLQKKRGLETVCQVGRALCLGITVIIQRSTTVVQGQMSHVGQA